MDVSSILDELRKVKDELGKLVDKIEEYHKKIEQERIDSLANQLKKSNDLLELAIKAYSLHLN